MFFKKLNLKQIPGFGGLCNVYMELDSVFELGPEVLELEKKIVPKLKLLGF
jgi:hypothetical protein